jgi:hypothetical protein
MIMATSYAIPSSVAQPVLKSLEEEWFLCDCQVIAFLGGEDPCSTIGKKSKAGTQAKIQ